MYFVSQPIVTNGLIANLDIGNLNSYTSASNTWNDLSGNNNTGSLINSPTYVAGNDGALVFNGTNNYVRLANGLLQTGSQTISLWINPSSWTHGGTFTGVMGGFCFGGPTQQGGISIALYKPNNALNVEAYNSTQRLARNIALPLTGSWHNITMTYNKDTATFKVYVNAVLRTSGVFSTVPSDILWGSNIFSLGATNVNGLVYYQGKIGSAMIYNRDISQFELQQNFNALKGRYGL
jgi:hypothetical protein